MRFTESWNYIELKNAKIISYIIKQSVYSCLPVREIIQIALHVTYPNLSIVYTNNHFIQQLPCQVSLVPLASQILFFH